MGLNLRVCTRGLRMNRVIWVGIFCLVASVALSQVNPWPVTQNDPAFLDRTVTEIYNRARIRIDSLEAATYAELLTCLQSDYRDTSNGLRFNAAIVVDTILGKTGAGSVRIDGPYLRSDYKDTSVGLYFIGAPITDSIASGSALNSVVFKCASGDPAAITFMEATANGTSRCTFRAYPDISSSWAVSLPAAGPDTIGQALAYQTQPGYLGWAKPVYPSQLLTYLRSDYKDTSNGLRFNAAITVDTVTGKTGAQSVRIDGPYLRSDYKDTSAGMWFTGGVKTDTLYSATVTSTQNNKIILSAGGQNIDAISSTFSLKPFGGGQPARLVLYDEVPGDWIIVMPPFGLAGNWVLTLPGNDGASAECLITDGSGTTSWSARATPSQLWSKTGDTLMAHGLVTLSTSTNFTIVNIGKTYTNASSYRAGVSWTSVGGGGVPANFDTLWVALYADGSHDSNSSFYIQHCYIASGTYRVEWTTVGN